MALFDAPENIVTSVRVTGSDITILKFDKKNNRVLNLYQHPLPEKVIEPGNIKDPQKLVATLKVAVAQAKAQGAPAIIGFPDDKTFTTTFTATALDNGNFAESIRWQAEEKLPADPKDYVFDWKKLRPASTDLDTSEIVIVAAPKTYLNPIISAVIQSGLRPLACEPTSISLARLAPPGKLCFVAEIRQTQSTIILVNEVGTVCLSSLVENPEEVVKKIIALNSFYTQKYQQRAETVFLCGEGATPEWVKFVSQNTQLTGALVSLPIAQNLPPKIHAFAVSFSLVQAETTPPKDTKSINLLPEEVQTMYEKLSEKKSLSFGVKFALTALTLTAIIMATTFILIKINLRGLQSQIEAEEQSTTQASYTSLAKTAEAANAQARTVSRLPSPDLLVVVIKELEAAIPQGVSVVTYTLDLPEQVLLVGGLATTRDALLLFKANLETKEVFDVVTIPLPTLEKQQDIPYSIAVDLAKPS
ncbi:MAG: pilus assembly protein PilM [Candidatus Chisholmbacteria bacterium]|nr:pilus assembly protein PilM [Candidatus Chisholmbacteria bacterium]